MEKGEILIRVTKSFMKNLGNYESARIEYGMEKIVDLEEEEIATQELSCKVDDFLNSELTELANSN